jgi:hypothetical protein
MPGACGSVTVTVVPPGFAVRVTVVGGGAFPSQTPSSTRTGVLQAPAPVIAAALGVHHTTTTRQAVNAGTTWSRYAPGDHDLSP